MDDESKKAARKSSAAVQAAHPRERAAFKALLLTNPNYFGNLADSSLTPVLALSRNTHYEELACVGYHPQQERLEAVVYIHQPSGYGSDICGAGTPEYVRFYLSFDDGATWQDQGLTSFQAHNIPEGTEGGRRLEYAVSLAVDPRRRFCFFDPLIRVRAILSWNNPPPANQPDWTPVWGNVREATILVEPRRLLFTTDIFEIAEVELSPALAEVLDLEAPIPTKAKALGAQELSTLYKDKDVPVHRFAYKELAAFTAASTTLSAESFLSLFPGLEIGPKISELLFPETDGDTSYEELRCIGLDPNSPDTLVGVIHVKKAAGYSGGPCTDGSREHVTFWADFDGNGSFETCLGTAQVRVYDLSDIPAAGVYYAVRLPVDLNPYRQHCRRGPKVVRIRAILSWNTPVPCANPNRVPTWGNREETLINIAPASGAPAGKIAILGGIPVSKIDNASGLTTATAVFATNNLPPDSLGRPCPFAGRVTLQGAPLPGHTYLVEVIPAGGGAPTPVVTDLWVTDHDGDLHLHQANPMGRFTYLPFTDNINGLLAQWDTVGDEKWTVRLSTFDPGDNLVGVDTQVVQLDNTGPEASITITSGLGNCGKFPAGTVLSGSFVARDEYFGGYSLDILPGDLPSGVLNPTSGVLETPPAPDGWSLDTTGMQACGYVIRVGVSDRAIVNSQAVGHHAADSAGFCLDAPQP